MLLITQMAWADEVARWDFEETSGSTATDESGLYVANLTGSDTLDVDGRFGSGIDFAGDGGASMDAASAEAFRFSGDFSVALWVRSDIEWGAHTRFIDLSAVDGGLQDSYRLFTHSGVNSDNFKFMSRQDGSNTQNIHTRDMPAETWILLVLRNDLDGDVTMNVLQDGDSVDAAFVTANSESWPTAGPIVYAEAELKFGRLIGGGRKFDGQMDGVAFYDHILSDADIATIFNKPPGSKAVAASPMPDDETIDVLRDVVLSWAPGEFAQTHDVYMGTVFEDVNNASLTDPLGVLASEGQDASSLDAGVLAFGQTYYWRVDEVNGAPDNTVFKGDVWSFTIEPFSIPVETIVATASSAHDTEMAPEKTIDGSGLDDQDQHSAEGTDMWLSGMGDPTPSIQYEFDRTYKLHEMWVWNSNQLIEGFVGLGAKEVTIEVSTDANDWTVLENTPDFAQAPGKAGYAHNTSIDLGGAIARYVRLTISGGYGMLPQSGLSEVRFFYIPTQPREPQPTDGATDVAVDTTLTWRAGREAASHQISLGTDPNAVALGTGAVNTTDASYDPGALDLASTYYWQVAEVNEAETPASHTGDTWSFSTEEFLVVDNFEGYDDNCDRIFFAWEDGLGHSGSEGIEGCAVSPSNGNGSGSIVGNAQAPFAETTIVHSGGKAMPLIYDGLSETTRSLSPAQDWTQHGIKGLVLWFAGDPANTGTDLYLKINNTKVSYDGPTNSLSLANWQMWYIDLQSMGGNLSNVSSLTIGLSSGQGMIYVDDIMLSPYERQLVTPTDPDPANLLAHLPFDGNANDSVGGLHGDLIENAAFAAGRQGQALSLNQATITDYVQLTGYKGIAGTSAFSIALWLKTTDAIEQEIVYFGTHTGGQRCELRVHSNGRIRMGNGSGQVEGFTDITDNAWHHVAITVKENATNSSSDVRIYIDGRDDTSESSDPDAYDIVPEWDLTIGYRPSQADRFFLGQIDEFYLYDRVLSPAEVAGLAGITQPFDRP